MKPCLYLIGSLRNPAVPMLGHTIRKMGFEVFDDWHGAGPEADDHWQKYEQARGRTYAEALEGYAAKHAFAFDKAHLERSDIGLLIMPAGKSGHLELGWMAGKGKTTYILFDQEPERWDVMVQFATQVFFDTPALMKHLSSHTPLSRSPK